MIYYWSLLILLHSACPLLITRFHFILDKHALLEVDCSRYCFLGLLCNYKLIVASALALASLRICFYLAKFIFSAFNLFYSILLYFLKLDYRFIISFIQFCLGFDLLLCCFFAIDSLEEFTVIMIFLHLRTFIFRNGIRGAEFQIQSI